MLNCTQNLFSFQILSSTMKRVAKKRENGWHFSELRRDLAISCSRPMSANKISHNLDGPDRGSNSKYESQTSEQTAGTGKRLLSIAKPERLRMGGNII